MMERNDERGSDRILAESPQVGKLNSPSFQKQKVKVISVVAAARSGTTLLARLLGEVDDCVNIGEFQALVAGVVPPGAPCGCGRTQKSCPVWGNITEALPDGFLEYGKRWMRTERFPFLALGYYCGGSFSRRFRQFLQTLQSTYMQIARRAGRRFIVESPKGIAYAFALTRLEDVDVYMVHLVRHPEEVVASWSKRKGYLGQKAMWRTLREWLLCNLWFEWLGRRTHWYRRVRFEDFVEKPKETLQSIVEGIFEHPMALPFVDSNRALLHEQHHLAGNPDKLRGEVFIRGDKKIPVSPGTRILTRLLMFPLLWHYKYL